MPEDRGLKHRTPISSTVNKEIWAELQKIAKETDIPISRLLDRSIKLLIEKYKNNPF
jgi:predicted DNA-binding ribbon-helix-helix protein